MTTSKYKIVEFDEGIEMIPITWLNRDRTMAYWPLYQNQIKINKAISSMETPKEDWKKCKIKKIVGQAESYEEAVDKVVMALELSDIESITPEEYKKSRHIRAKVRYSDDAYGSDGDSSDDLPVKKRNTSKILSSFPIAPNKEKTPKSKSPKRGSIMRKDKKSDVIMKNMSQDFQFNSPTQKYDDEDDINEDDINDEIEKDDGRLAKNGNSEPNIALESAVPSTSSTRKLDPLEKTFKKIEEQQDKPVEIAYLQEILFLQHKILLQLEELKKNRPTENVRRESSVLLTDTTVDICKFAESLPLKNEEDLKKMEKDLQKEEFRTKWMNYLLSLGGKNDQERVTTMMRKTLDNKLAINYSWLGFKKKKPFEKLQMAKCILNIVAATTKQNSTAKDVINWIGKWLSGAKQRYDREVSKEIQDEMDEENV